MKATEIHFLEAEHENALHLERLAHGCPLCEKQPEGCRSSIEAETVGTTDRMREIVRAITYKKGYRLRFVVSRGITKKPYIQVECERPDIVTGEIGIGRGGKFHLSPFMIEDEIVRAAFGLFLAYEEHEAREWFKYGGDRVFGPHISIAALRTAAKQVAVRPQP